MDRRYLSQYRGKLTPIQAAEGIRVAVQNANELLSDAEFLLANERWPRACALAILAIEEAAKPEMIRAMLVSRNQKELNQEWRSFRRHVKKNVAWILPQLASEGARILEDLRPIFDQEADHGQLIELVKQIAFYSDVHGDAHWSVPFDVVDQSLAEAMVSISRLLVPKKPGSLTTAPELELWIKHISPVWKQSMEEMKVAVLACYKEAEEKGILTGMQSAEEMARFLGIE